MYAGKNNPQLKRQHNPLGIGGEIIIIWVEEGENMIRNVKYSIEQVLCCSFDQPAPTDNTTLF